MTKKLAIIMFILASACWITPACAERQFEFLMKSHRLGIEGGLYFPTVKAKAGGADLEFQFHAKIHQNVDSGPSFGLFYRQVQDPTTDELTNYVIVPIKFSFRVYPFSATQDATHGLLAPYAVVNGGYYFSLLLDSNKFDSSYIPEGLGGFGGEAGVGLEMAFPFVTIPDFVVFAEAKYRTANLKSRLTYQLELYGFSVNVGARM